MFSNISDIPINFGDLDAIDGSAVIDHDHLFHESARISTTVGVCIKYGDGTKEILIRESAWNTYSTQQQEILIFHELGHCLLNRDHQDERYQGFKISIMNSILLNQTDYDYFYHDYIRELFTSNTEDLEFSIDAI